jgi:hypothetical protein
MLPQATERSPGNRIKKDRLKNHGGRSKKIPLFKA